jgi:ribosomal protein L11 methyltransferase
VSWFALRVEPRAPQGAVAEALFRSGAAGLHEDGSALVTHFPSEAEALMAVKTVALVDPEAECRIEEVVDTDWLRRWREELRDFTAGSLTIAPPWLASSRPLPRTIVIDPGMAFGTGDHASTRGAMRLLEHAVRPGCTVADLGSGSAVLSIGAAKLGAGRVYAIELDEDALGNAAENIARNDVGDRVHLIEGDAGMLLPLLAPVDVIVANILASVIVTLLPVMAAALAGGGHAVLAGILEDERHTVVDAAESQGWRLRAEDREDGWWSALIERA